MNIHEKSRYPELYARSMRDPEGFWADAAREIDWIEPAKKVFDASQDYMAAGLPEPSSTPVTTHWIGMSRTAAPSNWR